MTTAGATSPPLPAGQRPPGDPTPPVRPVSLQPAPERLAYSVQETAALLGVSDKTVRRLVDRKLLRVSRALRHLRIPKKEIERFLEASVQ
jgi:excisionase family DNA binding protein